jgi:hypothetical protein
MGLLSSSSSKSQSSSNTENLDKRIVADGGAGVISADRSNLLDSGGAGIVNLSLATGVGSSRSSAATYVDITNTDYGAIGAALQFAGKTVDAVAGEGFAALLDMADGLFERTSAAQASAMDAVSQAYAQADADKQGAIDNRTLLILAAVAAVVVVGVWGKWK